MLAVTTNCDDILKIGDTYIRVSRDRRGHVRLLISGEARVLKPRALEALLSEKGYEIIAGTSMVRDVITGEKLMIEDIT